MEIFDHRYQSDSLCLNTVMCVYVHICICFVYIWILEVKFMAKFLYLSEYWQVYTVQFSSQAVKGLCCVLNMGLVLCSHPLYVLRLIFLKSLFSIVLPPAGSSRWSLFKRFPHPYSLYTFYFYQYYLYWNSFLSSGSAGGDTLSCYMLEYCLDLLL